MASLFAELYTDLTSCWLDSIAIATMTQCIKQTLQITKLSDTGLKQLIMDLRTFLVDGLRKTVSEHDFVILEYLHSVLEDFGLKDVSRFRDLIELLGIDHEKFEELARHKRQEMVTAVHKMRHS